MGACQSQKIASKDANAPSATVGQSERPSKRIKDTEERTIRTKGNQNAMASVDNFTNMASLIYSIDSVKMLVADASGRQAFNEFLKQEHATENLTFYEEIEGLKVAFTGDDVGSSQALASKIVDTFLKTSSEHEVNLSADMRTDLISKLSDISDDKPRALLLKALAGAQHDVVVMLAMGPYSRFLQSPIYHEWRKTLEAEAIVEAGLLNATRTAVTASMKYRPDQLTFAVQSTDRLETETLLQSSSWVTNFIAATDNLPVAVAVATARADRPGFPLIFINKKFLKITGYEYSEVLGKSCKFLQRPDVIVDLEKQALCDMSSALKEGKAFMTILTNYRKSGEKFLNLLSLKPVFDQFGKYRYVVSVMLEIDHSNQSQMTTVAQSLSDLLPSKAFCYDNE